MDGNSFHKKINIVLKINAFKLIVFLVLSISYCVTIYRYYHGGYYLVLQNLIEMIFIPISLLLAFIEAELIGARYKIWIGFLSFSIPLIMLASFYFDFSEETLLIAHLLSNVFSFLLVIGFIGYMIRVKWALVSIAKDK